MVKRISMERLIEFGVAFMTKRDVPEDHALYVSRIVVETEAFRQSTHGLAQYVAINEALGKTIDPQVEPTIIGKHGATVLLDGKRCLGILVMKLAKKMAVEIARTDGVGFVGVRNTHWIGALGMHLISIAEQGLLCQAWAQTNTCQDCAPYCGIDPRFSTNPIALAFPTDGNPVVADFSTATISMGAAHALIKEGKKTATSRFLDNTGSPSNDPSVIDRDGSLMFMGGDIDGHKGYALSLFNEALTVLAGGSANNPDAELHQSFSLMILDPAVFVGSDYFFEEMRRFLAYVKSSRVRSHVKEIRLPGERGFAALADCRIHGVPLDDNKLRILRELADDNGIEAIE
ncbi:MAG: Ldh family oxidoreductase [SAR202 cluster bacterium]|nr:Ldh family oxidoreductase [SAR202 cluster bacterium]